jgi:flagellar biosynthetic protein FliR
MPVTIDILPGYAVTFMLMFARIGTLVMLMPGLGERSVFTRFRLSMALMITLVFFPVAQAAYPTDLSGPLTTFRLLFIELGIGLVLGITGRLLMSCLVTAGAVIAQLLGLGFVTSVDPTQGQQGALVGTFLTIAGVALIFALDLHHLAIGAIGMSYDAFQPGILPDIGDSARYVIKLMSASFMIGIQMSAPFIIFGLVFNIGLGLLARMMPQMQVFFVGLPASLALGYIILALVFGAMMMLFADHLRAGLGNLVTR